MGEEARKKCIAVVYAREKGGKKAWVSFSAAIKERDGLFFRMKGEFSGIVQVRGWSRGDTPRFLAFTSTPSIVRPKSWALLRRVLFDSENCSLVTV